MLATSTSCDNIPVKRIACYTSRVINSGVQSVLTAGGPLRLPKRVSTALLRSGGETVNYRWHNSAIPTHMSLLVEGVVCNCVGCRRAIVL